MRKLNRIILIMAALVCLCAQSAARRADLYLGDKQIHSFSDFQLIDDTVFLPLKESCRALGIDGSADAQSQNVFFRTGGKLVIVDTQQKKVAVGTEVSDIPHKPIWTRDEVYIPHQVYTEVLAGVMGKDIRVEASDGDVTVSSGNILRNPVDVIVIDPGHGGHDPGARGPSGVVEKDIVLSIAKKLKERLSKEPGLTVYLTRDGDTFVELSNRPRKATELGADAFVSIHANGYQRVSAEGFETFFASLEATDQAALDLAQLENQASLATDTPDEVLTDIEAILGDMAQTESLADSQRLAEMVQVEMSRVMKSDNRGVKQAPFNVLMNATMPAVLVEVGFVTSPREAKAITDQDTQELIVEAIANAVIKYRAQANARLGLAP